MSLQEIAKLPIRDRNQRVSTERFINRIGRIENDQLKELLAGLVICVEYDPDG